MTVNLSVTRKILCLMLAGALTLALCSCADISTSYNEPLVVIEEDTVPLAGGSESDVKKGIKGETENLPGEAAIPHSATAVPSGEKTKYNSEVIIDYSNAEDGYVMVKYIRDTDKKLKAQVKGPKTTYTFNLEPNKWAAFPLADESGQYKISVFKNASGSKYASVLSATVKVTLSDPFAPFLHSNQYVDFDNAPDAVALADKLCKDLTELEMVEEVYHYVVENLSYDYKLAKSVKSGYLPDLDQVLEKGKGICFDYAALMTGMLRSQGVPCKLAVGYAGDVYHAWISVWTADTGWIDGIVFFDGESWQRMDPTFASSADGDEEILDFIGNGKNYSVKYIY